VFRGREPGPIVSPHRHSLWQSSAARNFCRSSNATRSTSLAGVRGFDGEFEKSIFIKGIDAKELTPNSGATLMLESARVQQQIARARPEHWAMVHAMGFATRGAVCRCRLLSKVGGGFDSLGRTLNWKSLHRVIMGR